MMMKTFEISWAIQGTIPIEAESKEEAIKLFNEDFWDYLDIRDLLRCEVEIEDIEEETE